MKQAVRTLGRDAIEAGPELDAMIAEKVMGYRVQANPRTTLKGGPLLEFTPQGYQLLPRYSRNIAAAWRIVEKMMPEIGHVYPSVDAETGKLEHWCAVVEKGESERFGVVAPTLPLAICRAALRVVTLPSHGCTLKLTGP